MVLFEKRRVDFRSSDDFLSNSIVGDLQSIWWKLDGRRHRHEIDNVPGRLRRDDERGWVRLVQVSL
jgi:hypothetical protein